MPSFEFGFGCEICIDVLASVVEKIVRSARFGLLQSLGDNLIMLSSWSQ